jgi:hypothetical protein
MATSFFGEGTWVILLITLPLFPAFFACTTPKKLFVGILMNAAPMALAAMT